MNAHSPITPATTADPILSLIAAYHSGRDEFDQWASLNPLPRGREEDKAWDDLVYQHYHRIAYETPVILTLDGAKALLKFIADDRDRDFEDGVPLQIVRAISDCLDRLEAAQ